MTSSLTTWTLLEQAATALREPFTRAQILRWFAQNHPECHPPTVSAYIQYATAEAPVESRGTFAGRTPLISRTAQGQYVRHSTAVATWATEHLTSSTSLELRGAGPPPMVAPEDWTEARTQAAIVRHLATTGWDVLAVADTASKAHGFDVVAIREGERLLVEVKGYPSSTYADPARASETKPTVPSNQARQWYSHAILKALLTIQEHPEAVAALGLPDATTYRNLVRRTSVPLGRLGVRVLWVNPDGEVAEQHLGNYRYGDEGAT